MNTWDRCSATCDAEEDKADEDEADEERVYEYFGACTLVLHEDEEQKKPRVKYNSVAVNVSQEAVQPDTRALELLSKTSELKLVDGSLVAANHASSEMMRPDKSGLDLLSKTSALLVGGSLVAVDQSADVESDSASSACKRVSPSPERAESPVSMPSSTMQLFMPQ
jgi:hypothetical protein